MGDEEDDELTKRVRLSHGRRSSGKATMSPVKQREKKGKAHVHVFTHNIKKLRQLKMEREELTAISKVWADTKATSNGRSSSSHTVVTAYDMGTAMHMVSQQELPKVETFSEDVMDVDLTIVSTADEVLSVGSADPVVMMSCDPDLSFVNPSTGLSLSSGTNDAFVQRAGLTSLTGPSDASQQSSSPQKLKRPMGPTE
jgi:hypothetical protein